MSPFKPAAGDSRVSKVIPFPSRHLPAGEPDARCVVGSLTAHYNGRRVPTQIATIVQNGEPFHVGKWLVEPSQNRVSCEESSIQVELKAMDVLLCLAESAGEVVSKHAILDTVWQTEFVSDKTIVSRIAELRSALGDDAQTPSYIETIRKRGYRLIAEVRSVTTPSEPAPSFPEVPSPPEEEQNPYPGLAAFNESDADRFFGREIEVRSLWRKITSRRLVAVIGPSGIGKSSLLRAGVAPRAPPGWRVVVFTPGESPALSLARALAPDHSGDPAAVARLVGFNDADTALAVVSRWRGQFREAVLVVDQFEELFTLNPREVQAAFIGMLRRLVDAADVHVVLAMRDDFLFHCEQYPQIAPIFKDLTPVGPPKGEGLRRALKEPAARLLYRFESELLVDRMISEVADERGALPMMAFAAHRLWEERDREQRVLTEGGYEGIGGVAGALARHAEATLERIGGDRLPIVRDVFRNLVTAEGTRAVRQTDDLLSVFNEHERDEAAGVLRELIDARLLTSFEEEMCENGNESKRRRVEIIHESLLSNWPRLVHWQTQDADSARLRDELRQAARTWDEHERSKDFLWDGRALREFGLWRETYRGGLTELEECFAQAITSHAKRRQRRRRIVVSAVIAILLLVLGIVSVSRQQAVAEASRAEAAKLLALGQLQLEGYPTSTLAHALASMELADTFEGRWLALRALWEGPTALVINKHPSRATEFTPDGDWLTQSIQLEKTKQLGIVAKDGSRTDFNQVFDFALVLARVNPEGTVLFSMPEMPSDTPQHVVLWSLPNGRKLSDVRFDPPAFLHPRVIGWNRNRFLALVREGDLDSIHAINFDGTSERLGTLDPDVQSAGWYYRSAMDLRTGRLFAAVENGTVSVVEIGDHDLSEARVLGSHQGTGHRVALDPEGRFVATSNEKGLIKVWNPTGAAPPVVFRGPKGIKRLGIFGHEPRLAVRTSHDGTQKIWVYSFTGSDPRLLRTFEDGPERVLGLRQLWGWDPGGRRYARNSPDLGTRLWSLSAPADAEPLVLRRGDIGLDWYHSFHPNGQWLATADLSGLMVWPLSRPYPSVIRNHQSAVWSVEFGPDGEWIASGCMDGIVRLAPLSGEVPEASRIVGRRPSTIRDIALSPDGKHIVVSGENWGATVIPLDGGGTYQLGDLLSVFWAAHSPDGRLAAIAGRTGDNLSVVQVLRIDTAETNVVMEFGELEWPQLPHFLDDGDILVSSKSGLWRLDPTMGASEMLFDGVCVQFAASQDGRRIVLVELSDLSWVATGRAVFLDLDAGTRTYLTSHGDQVWSVAMDAAGGTVVTGDTEGVLRVGSTSGEEPHLLLGHEGRIWSVDLDPLGRWIATGGQDATVRIWPMPDLNKTPLHTLPHDEFVAKLKTLTNLRMARDEESPSGWTLTHDPFPGWETVPTW